MLVRTDLLVGVTYRGNVLRDLRLRVSAEEPTLALDVPSKGSQFAQAVSSTQVLAATMSFHSFTEITIASGQR